MKNDPGIVYKHLLFASHDVFQHWVPTKVISVTTREIYSCQKIQCWNELDNEEIHLHVFTSCKRDPVFVVLCFV